MSIWILTALMFAFLAWMAITWKAVIRNVVTAVGLTIMAVPGASLAPLGETVVSERWV